MFRKLKVQSKLPLSWQPPKISGHSWPAASFIFPKDFSYIFILEQAATSETRPAAGKIATNHVINTKLNGHLIAIL